MSSVNHLQSVLDCLKRDPKMRIPMTQIESASKSNCISVLSILREIIIRHWSQIAPEPDKQICFNVLIRFYRMCIENAPDPTETVLSRYEAATELYRTIKHWTQMGDEYFPFVTSAVQNLRDSYLSGTGKIRTAIETGCIEHLFESDEIIPFFQEWKDHELLREVYDRALGWAHPKYAPASDNNRSPKK